ncbi:ferredoxin [archaeon]|jgi:ferredoxin|nr:ferredoxin [archaeon]MBT4351400.1 ferredoxin [archaeon]MBT4648195.1 ferredoxin [archaeon]MBT6822245.1 ferredoxin [archaeon]MBT7392619.1 ferredoxin [archaeon]
MKISHQRDKCIGCNSCVEDASEYWKISKEDGKADLLGSIKKGNFYILETSNIDIEKNKKAAEICPVNIIKIYE